MPYRLAEIAAKYNVYYYPIVSSARAFRALWKRAYHRLSEWLGGVVYEDPWRAGGHNGLSNSEDPASLSRPTRGSASCATRCAMSGSMTPRSSWRAASGICASGRTGSTTRSSARSASSSGPGRS